MKDQKVLGEKIQALRNKVLELEKARWEDVNGASNETSKVLRGAKYVNQIAPILKTCEELGIDIGIYRESEKPRRYLSK